jgi:hypothetical protein
MHRILSLVVVTLCVCVTGTGSQAALITVNTGGLIALDNNGSPETAEVGVTSHTYTQVFSQSNVTFTLSFLLGTPGAGYFLHNNLSDQSDAIGVWSNTNGGENSDATRSRVNKLDETLTVSNVQISNVTGGTAVFNGITEVGLLDVLGNADRGRFTIGSITMDWDSFSTIDGFESLTDLDGGGGGNSFLLQNAYQNAGGTGIINGFTLGLRDSVTNNSWKLDAVRFDVTVSAVPEPSSWILMALLTLGIVSKVPRRSGFPLIRVLFG